MFVPGPGRPKGSRNKFSGDLKEKDPVKLDRLDTPHPALVAGPGNPPAPHGALIDAARGGRLG